MHFTTGKGKNNLQFILRPIVARATADYEGKLQICFVHPGLDIVRLQTPTLWFLPAGSVHGLDHPRHLQLSPR